MGLCNRTRRVGRAAVSVTAVASLLALSGCGTIIGTSEAQEIARINVSSPDLREGKPLPRQFSCQGNQGSPPLRWSSRPLEEAETVAIVVDSNSAESSGVYWVLYNIPATTTELGPNAAESPPEGSAQAPVTSGRKGYEPPCVPKGTYRFSVYTLKGRVGEEDSQSLSDVLRKIADLTIARGRLTVVDIE
jgi:Raf kinase inhibitor-like YbhB/YbcL family protein